MPTEDFFDGCQDPQYEPMNAHVEHRNQSPNHHGDEPANSRPEALAEDQEMLLRILAKHNVQMVVLGGVGAQFHGWKSATTDLDIAVDKSDDNVARLNRALVEMDAGQPEYGQFGTAFNTKHGRLELVRKADGIGEYEDWLRNAGEKDLDEGLTIVVATPATS